MEDVRSLKVGSHRIRVSIHAGDGRSTPLLLCGGLGASLETLAPFAEALDPARPVIRWDAPGAGLSSPPTFPYRLCVMATLMHDLLGTLGIERAHVLGMSWGGMLAQQFAFQYPDQCDRLVLASTGCGLILPSSLPVLLKLSSHRRHTDPDHLASIGPEIYGGAVRIRPGLTSILAEGRPPHPVGYLFQQLAAVGWASLPFLPFLKQTTLILNGDDDPLTPLATAQLMSALIPNARLHVFPDGHLGLMTHAVVLGPVVDTFLGVA